MTSLHARIVGEIEADILSGALAAGWAVHALGGEITFLLAGGAPALIALAVVLTSRSMRALPAPA